MRAEGEQLSSLPRHSGPSKDPLRRIRQAIYPPESIRRRNVDSTPWRVSRHDNLPSSPSMASRNEFWTTEGVSTFFLGGLVREHGIHRTQSKKKDIYIHNNMYIYIGCVVGYDYYAFP